MHNIISYKMTMQIPRISLFHYTMVGIPLWCTVPLQSYVIILDETRHEPRELYLQKSDAVSSGLFSICQTHLIPAEAKSLV